MFGSQHQEPSIMIGIILLLFLGPLLVVVSAEASHRPPHYYSCRPYFNASEPRLPHPFCNSSLSLDHRLNDLLGRLSTFEKTMVLDADGYAVPRLGLPRLGGIEVTHGVAANPCGSKNTSNNNTGCGTEFPSGTGLGATFDRTLWRDIGRTIGTELRGLHNQNSSTGTTLASLYALDPNINLMRDPRWGRAQEVPGEDPYLTSEYAVHVVSGEQQYDDPNYMLSAVTVKHFSLYDFEGYFPYDEDPGPAPYGYCDTPGGCERWNSDSLPPLADFLDYYLVPFRQAVTRAQPASIMCSYNAVYGKPTCADGTVNDQIVREEWGFEGFFVSDCTALELFQNVKWDSCKHPWPSEGGTCVPQAFPGGHNYTHTIDDTIHAALVQGGIDLNCGKLYSTNLYSSLLSGAVTPQDVDRAAKKIFRVMMKLGMLDPQEDQPLVNDFGPDQVDSEANRQLALQAAWESIVLLKNDNNILPLAANKSVALIGPHANASQALLSNYFGKNILVNSNTPFMSAVSSKHFSNVSYALGAQICDFDKNPNVPCDKAGPNQTLIQEAVQLAREVNTVVLLLGSDQTTEAEGVDRKSLLLAGNGSQQTLLEQVVQANPNTVVVLIHGGPVALDDNVKLVPAIVDAFYPGELGGPAIVDVLTGAYNPGGKLPYTNYLSDFVQDRDIRNVDLASQQGITHLYYKGKVSFPFGHGLSFTQFRYTFSNESDALASFDDDRNTTSFTIKVQNTGPTAGDAVCLAFLRHPSYGKSDRQLRQPLAKLFGFERVHLDAGQAKEVRFELSAVQAALVDETTAERILPSGISWTVEIGDIVTPAQKRVRFLSQIGKERIVETNDVVRQRYDEWKASNQADDRWTSSK